MHRTADEMQPKASRIALIVEHQLVVEALGALIDSRGIRRIVEAESTDSNHDFNCVASDSDIPQQRLRVVYAGCAASFRLGKVAQSRPDLCVVDADLRDNRALEIAASLRSKFVNSKLLLIGEAPSDTGLAEACRLEPQGYLLKSESARSLRRCLLQIADGQTYFSQDVSSRLRFDARRRQFVVRDGHRLARLTRKELEVLRHLASGDSVKLIAGKLHVSPKTVDNHKYRIMHKVDIHDRVHLAHFAIREGLIQLRESGEVDPSQGTSLM